MSGIEFVERVHAVPPPFSLPIMALNLTSWLGFGLGLGLELALTLTLTLNLSPNLNPKP